MENKDTTNIKYSVIVLLEEKARDFSQHMRVLFKIFQRRKMPFEIIIISNGMETFINRELVKLSDIQYSIKAFVLNRRTPQAVCLKSGIKKSSGEIIVSCGSYQQITLESFDLLLDSFDNEVDVISPWRQNRVDPVFNQFQSEIFNILVRKATKFNIHDLSCTVKIFRRYILEDIILYGNMYRFLPILAEEKGFCSKEIKCDHYQEQGQTGFYYPSEYIKRLVDVFTLYFNIRFTRKPLRLFSTIGAGFMAAGLFIGIYVFIRKIFFGHGIGEQAVLLFALLFLMLGMQVASIGLLGEIVAYTRGRFRKEYTIEKII